MVVQNLTLSQMFENITIDVRLSLTSLINYIALTPFGAQDNPTGLSELEKNKWTIDQETQKVMRLKNLIALKERATAAAESVIESEGAKEGGNCTICLDTLKDREVKVLPCHRTHVFHVDCLKKVIEVGYNITCPNCRADIPDNVVTELGGRPRQNTNPPSRLVRVMRLQPAPLSTRFRVVISRRGPGYVPYPQIPPRIGFGVNRPVIQRWRSVRISLASSVPVNPFVVYRSVPSRSPASP